MEPQEVLSTGMRVLGTTSNVPKIGTVRVSCDDRDERGNEHQTKVCACTYMCVVFVCKSFFG